MNPVAGVARGVVPHRDVGHVVAEGEVPCEDAREVYVCEIGEGDHVGKDGHFERFRIFVTHAKQSEKIRDFHGLDSDLVRAAVAAEKRCVTGDSGPREKFVLLAVRKIQHGGEVGVEKDPDACEGKPFLVL